MPILYLVHFPNGKRYAGVTSRTLAYRKAGHKRALLNGVDNKFYRALRKYGFDSVQWEVVGQFATFSDACAAECRLIAELGLQKAGYNTTSGGQGNPGREVSDEERLRHSIAQTKRFNRVDERVKTRDAVLRALVSNPKLKTNFVERMGKHFADPANRQLAAERQLAYCARCPESVAASAKKRRQTYAERPEIGSQISRSLGGRPIVVTKDGEIVGRFETQHECSRVLNVGLGNIQHVLRGTRQHSKGYVFAYADS